MYVHVFALDGSYWYSYIKPASNKYDNYLDDITNIISISFQFIWPLTDTVSALMFTCYIS